MKCFEYFFIFEPSAKIENFRHILDRFVPPKNILIQDRKLLLKIFTFLYEKCGFIISLNS